MRVVVCALAKNEHLYINEWVKHYIDLGFSHIYLYDNDNPNSPYIGNFIDKTYADKITIYNIRGVKQKYLQHHVYNNFYHTHSFDWCLFCDIDEFLVGISNVIDFLNDYRLKNYAQIRIKWRLFGDDNKISRDVSKPVHGFFKNEIKGLELCNQSKSFIRGNLPCVDIHSCHYIKGLKSCYPSGKECQSNKIELIDYDDECVFMYHYMTKTLDEFIKQKLNRGDAVWETRSIDFSYFWRINEKTEEKLEYIKNMGLA